MLTTEQHSPTLIQTHYSVHFGIGSYAWFETYDEAHDFLFSKWVDNRFAKEVVVPVEFK